jgi:hypothetical protein
MSEIEATPRSAFFIEDTDEIDHDLAADDRGSERLWVMNVCSDSFDVGQHGEMPSRVRITRRQFDSMP